MLLLALTIRPHDLSDQHHVWATGCFENRRIASFLQAFSGLFATFYKPTLSRVLPEKDHNAEPVF